MNPQLFSLLIVPGAIALVFLLVVTYLQRQTREPQFHIWQAIWLLYLVHFLALGVGSRFPQDKTPFLLTSNLAMVATALLLVLSARKLKRRDERHIDILEIAFGVIGTLWAFALVFYPTTIATRVPIEPEIGLALVLGYAGWRFNAVARVRDSVGYRTIAIALGLWAVLLTCRRLEQFAPGISDRAVQFSPIIQVLLGVSMVMVMFEYERRMVQENALALSTLEIDKSRILAPEELAPAIADLLVRMMPYAKTHKAWIYISEPWRGILPCVQQGLDDNILVELLKDRVCEPLCELSYRRGGFATIRNLNSAEIPGLAADNAVDLATRLAGYNITSLTAVGLQGRERQVGALVFPHDDRRTFGSAEMRLLLALTLQVGTTLDNYVIMHEAQRRTREYEMLTQIGQVISSQLDPDEVLQAIHRELGKFFDNGTFYVAFMDGNVLRFEFETTQGEVQPKRSRKATAGLPEYIVKTGTPLLVRSDVKRRKAELGLTHEGRGAKSFVGVPINMNGRTAGVICALNFDREFVYGQRDLEVLQTAAGQLAVAMENALLYSEASRRAHYLSFLNNIANTAISRQTTDEMLTAIVTEIERNFDFDHIGIGVFDYTTKDIEIKAEASKTVQMLGRRISIGVGIMGRVARSGEPVTVQNTGEPHLLGLLPDARSVMCIPLRYGETLLGVLNVESRSEAAFAPQDSLLLSTLGDLLATALHNALVFQKMEQHSITDSLTGIKTRRFFVEALQSEWKRASRSGRAFSIVLIDLDKFKEVNDSMGHLEGDLVLARVGRLLEQKCRQSNVVARYGGDEFIVMMPETGVEQAQVLAERLRLWLATDPMLAERNVTGSFGVASFPLHGATVDEIIRVADAGMYVSKHGGGNRVSTADVASDYEVANQQRQQILTCVDSFAARKHVSEDDAEELVSNLRRLTAPLPQDDASEVVRDALRQLAHVAEVRESGNTTHGEEVATYAEIIARRISMSEEAIEDLRYAAIAHDIGKIIVPAQILNRKFNLATDEHQVIERHSTTGARIISSIPGKHMMQDWIRHHHERIDGSGYPDKLRGDAIPLGARIIGIADAFVTMTTELPYSPSKSPAEALREMENATHLYDKKLVAALAAHVRGERVAGVASQS
jgi:diguanylate cyclase (GGDEF)-like protein